MRRQVTAAAHTCTRLVLAVTAAAILAWSSECLALDKLHWQLAWLPTGEYAAFTAAVAKGLYKEEGIDLTYSRGFGSGDAVKKVAAGSSPSGTATSPR